MGSVCWWCGYSGSLQRLVAANADYVVDGMCRQLRQVKICCCCGCCRCCHARATSRSCAPLTPLCRCFAPPPLLQLDAYPRAPQLFTALLQQAGVAPQLLPLLAEPARSAIQVRCPPRSSRWYILVLLPPDLCGTDLLTYWPLPACICICLQGLGILARRQQPQHVLAFLQTLLPVAAAANAVARQALSEMRQAADEVQQRWDVHQREIEQQEAGGVSASATQEEIARYFERRRQQKEQEEAEGHPLEAMERGGAALPAAA